MSLSEAQQIFDLLSEIDKILGSIQTKIDQIETKGGGSKELTRQFNELNRGVRTYLLLASKAGIGGDVGQAIQLLSRLAAMLWQASYAYNALLAATGIGIPIAIANVAITGLTVGNVITGMTGYR